MDRGFFGELFDLDHDGELDSLEKAMDLMAFNELVNELSSMDEDERREALEDAGLDPEEYDF